MLDELQLKRERENQEAERHRRRRDELNDKTREWVEKRDSLNAQVRALVDEATQHRIQRDELNAQVKVAKEARDKYNRRVNELQDQLSEVKRRKLPRGAVPLGKLQQDLKRLEFKQMTSVLSVDKERALIEEIQRLQGEVRKLEKALEENEDVRKAKEELKAARDLAEEAHKRVSELAEKAQAESSQKFDFYIEPGTTTLRAPDGSRQVMGKVVIDLKNGRVWGFPTLGSQPYPVDITKLEPPLSRPIYLGQYDFAATNR